MGRLARTLAVLIALGWLASCNLLANWRDSQIQASHTAAQQGGPVLPPPVPIVVPDSVLRDLPLDKSFTFLQYTKNGDNVEIKAISAWDAATTSNWMLARLTELGYDSGDNPSRILEGCDYYGNQGAKYKVIRAKVDLNASDQCLVEISSTPKG